jgi:hypothetical protein
MMPALVRCAIAHLNDPTFARDGFAEVLTLDVMNPTHTLRLDRANSSGSQT